MHSWISLRTVEDAQFTTPLRSFPVTLFIRVTGPETPLFPQQDNCEITQSNSSHKLTEALVCLMTVGVLLVLCFTVFLIVTTVFKLSRVYLYPACKTSSPVGK